MDVASETILLIAAVAALIFISAAWYIRRVRDDADISKVRKGKIKLVLVVVIGTVVGIAAFLISLAYGPAGGIPIGESLSGLISAIQKGGEGLTATESYIYYSRLPRALAALAVGIGLSVAGAMYQSVIRNPLVDPYITGVSSGAGLAAITAIVFGSAIGILAGASSYVTPVAAIIGGIAAFGATMLIAERSGGSSVNYVLGGVIIGLAFSSVQTLILSLAGDKVNDAIFWLFGSFANITWGNVWLVVIPIIGMSLAALFWAREFNLVLLGEDQARQMGLNVRRFNMSMLTLASVLTAACVAFVGIIGFVGLVVPHLCRMILGGDNRMVIPASIVLGGALMLLADLVARMAFVPYELPVGAITTIIGTPIFVYLLIKKGREYNG
jgi:iron complex transport system permease protein